MGLFTKEKSLSLKLYLIPLLMFLWKSPSAHAWGEIGHELIAELGSNLVDPKVLENCHVTTARIVEHTNDPDQIWRQKRSKYPQEERMHYIHVDRQPSDWRKRQTPSEPRNGWLVYRIVSWSAEARKLRQLRKWDELTEKLYGLSHYIGDLSQPLHVNHDYDGRKAGLPGIHSQFESKMISRFKNEVRSGVQERLSHERIPSLWSSVDYRELIFDIAEQNSTRAKRLFSEAKIALKPPKRNKNRSYAREPKPRFVKKDLWRGTGSLAMDQLAQGARLWAHTLNTVCR